MTPEYRARVAWTMQLEDVLLGAMLGFEYPMSGDERP